MVIDEDLLERIGRLHQNGARIRLRRTHDGGKVRVEKGPFHMFSEKFAVNTATFEAIKAIIQPDHRDK